MMKRILALLLAGLLLLSLASCVAGGENAGDETDDETVDTSDEENTNDEDETNDDEDDEWEEVDDVVYTFKSVALRQEPGGDNIRALDAELALHRTRVSNNWSFVSVEIEGETLEGYVSNNYITEIDILGSDFTKVAGGSKTMYCITDGLNVRKYPTSNNNISPSMDSLNMDDEVKVVAENGSWYRIEVLPEDAEEDEEAEPLYYYVSAKHIAPEKGGESTAKPSYQASFIDCNPTETMYTTTAGLRLRSEPVISSETVITTLSTAGIKVVVLKRGNVNANGETKAWSYVKAYIPPKNDGDPIVPKEGYIATEYLTYDEPASTANLSLDELLVRYPTFVKGEKFVYVIKNISLKVRSTPVITTGSADSADSNVIGSLKTDKDALAATSVKALASGVVDGNAWYIIDYVDPVSGKTIKAFISANPLYVTTDPSGEFKLTRDNLTFAYPTFTLVDAQTITAVATANGYYTPEVPTGDDVTIPYQLGIGDQATLIARQTGAKDNLWYAIEVSGVIYFVPISSFAPITNG